MKEFLNFHYIMQPCAASNDLVFSISSLNKKNVCYLNYTVEENRKKDAMGSSLYGWEDSMYDE